MNSDRPAWQLAGLRSSRSGRGKATITARNYSGAPGKFTPGRSEMRYTLCRVFWPWWVTRSGSPMALCPGYWLSRYNGRAGEGRHSRLPSFLSIPRQEYSCDHRLSGHRCSRRHRVESGPPPSRDSAKALFWCLSGPLTAATSPYTGSPEPFTLLVFRVEVQLHRIVSSSRRVGELRRQVIPIIPVGNQVRA